MNEDLTGLLDRWERVAQKTFGELQKADLEVARLRARIAELEATVTPNELRPFRIDAGLTSPEIELRDKVVARDRVIDAAFKALEKWEYDAWINGDLSAATFATREARRLRAELEGTK